MIKKVRIYVEGINDIVFLKNYLETVFNFKIDYQGKKDTFENEKVLGSFVATKGWGKINTSYYHKEFEDNANKGFTTLIILDADTIHNDGGFGVRQAQVEAVQATIPFEYFLIPNGGGDGYLETLLSNIIVEEYRDALQCLRGQDECLRAANASITGKQLKVSPDKAADKAVMNTFMSRLKNEGQNKFKDATIWNLNHVYLAPLKNFLQAHLNTA